MRVRHAGSMSVALLVILHACSARSMSPEERARVEAAKMIEGQRSLSLLASRHPEIRDDFVKMMEEVVRKGGTLQQARAAGLAWGRTRGLEYIQRYLPRASDQAVVNYVSTVIDLLEELRREDEDACFLFLFGHGSEGVERLSKLLEAHQKRIDVVTAEVTIRPSVIPALRSRQRRPSDSSKG